MAPRVAIDHAIARKFGAGKAPHHMHATKHTFKTDALLLACENGRCTRLCQASWLPRLTFHLCSEVRGSRPSFGRKLTAPWPVAANGEPCTLELRLKTMRIMQTFTRPSQNWWMRHAGMQRSQPWIQKRLHSSEIGAVLSSWVEVTHRARGAPSLSMESMEL